VIGMGDSTIDAIITDRWADQTARTMRLVRTISTTLLVGAGVAVALGLIVAAVALDTDFGDPGLLGPGGSYRVGQVAGSLLTCLTPAGLLLAAGGYLRLQAARFETELLVEDLETA
jgi:ABC-type cobalamin transport system permease subunit